MAKVFIEETTLTAIGDAIREKTGGTDLIAPGNMPTEIKGIVSGGDGDCNGLHIPEEALVISGDCAYRFVYNGWNWFIEEYSDKITTNNLESGMNMFWYSSELTNIPFDLNFKIPTSTTLATSMTYMFANCTALLNVPNVKTIRPSDMNSIFDCCKSLKSISDDWTDTWDWSKIDNSTSAYQNNTANMFSSCYNLRNIPTWTFLHMNPVAAYSYATIYGAFNYCYSLEKVEGIRLPANATWTSNAFYNTFNNCYRLKSITFALQDDGSPYVHNISKQTIDLTKVGYITPGQNNLSVFLLSCPDFTTDDEIDSYAKWVAYCGEDGSEGSGNGYAYGRQWCVFGRTAVKKMFATLPDVTGGSNNTIKLDNQVCVGNNDLWDEPFSALTEEEIAVATAKGWTITYA